jgi:hypothetical protein
MCLLKRRFILPRGIPGAMLMELQVKSVSRARLIPYEMYFLKSKNNRTMHTLRRRSGSKHWQYAAGRTGVHTYWRDVSELHAQALLKAYNFSSEDI